MHFCCLGQYTNPPWNLIGITLAQVQTHQARLVFVAPVWKVQPWYHQLILIHKETMLNLSPTITLPNHPQLAAWDISGINTEDITFLKKLQISCSNHGDKKLTGPMIRSFQNVLAGVLNGVQILFLDLMIIGNN